MSEGVDEWDEASDLPVLLSAKSFSFLETP